MKEKNKLNARLTECRIELIIIAWEMKYTAEEIGEIFNININTVYKIIKQSKSI